MSANLETMELKVRDTPSDRALSEEVLQYLYDQLGQPMVKTGILRVTPDPAAGATKVNVDGLAKQCARILFF